MNFKRVLGFICPDCRIAVRCDKAILTTTDRVCVAGTCPGCNNIVILDVDTLVQRLNDPGKDGPRGN